MIILAIVISIIAWVWAFVLLGNSHSHPAYFVAGHVMVGLACICTSLIALVATVGLAALFIIHIIYAFWLTMQNRKARGSERYAVTEKPKTVEWASQNMLVLGIIVIVGLGLHLVNFWAKMQLPELMHNMGMHADTLTLAYAANGVYHIQNTFSNPVFVVLYLVWLGALWFHLTHGFWSSMQSLGWNNKVWIDRWKCISNIYSTIVVLCFALVVVVFFAKSLCGAC